MEKYNLVAVSIPTENRFFYLDDIIDTAGDIYRNMTFSEDTIRSMADFISKAVASLPENYIFPHKFPILIAVDIGLSRVIFSIINKQGMVMIDMRMSSHRGQ
jgi:hypothetical protein